MSKYICIDSSVFVKLFFEENDSNKAKDLIRRVIKDNQIIALPSFARAEIGSIFRKKVRSEQVSIEVVEEMWQAFSNFPGIEYVKENLIMDLAWDISCSFDLPTLYDAAFLAVAEEITNKTMEVCQFWTADERLVNSLRDKKDYVFCLSLYSG